MLYRANLVINSQGFRRNRIWQVRIDYRPVVKFRLQLTDSFRNISYSRFYKFFQFHIAIDLSFTFQFINPFLEFLNAGVLLGYEGFE